MTDLTNIFKANPASTLIITDLGHAYGTAKFSSTCQLTGMQIVAFEAIRRITVATRSGHTWEGHTSNNIVAHLQTSSHDAGFHSRVSRCSHDWVERIEEAMASATAGTTLTLVDKGGMKKSYTLGTMGKWQSRSSRSSTAQVLSSLKRSTAYRLFTLA